MDTPLAKNFVYFNIQVFNKKFKQILLTQLLLNKITYGLFGNSLFIRALDNQLLRLLILLKNFDKKNVYSLKSDKLYRTSNRAFLIDSLEEQGYLDIESRPKPVRKKGKKYKSWRKFNKSVVCFWNSRILKRNFVLKFFRFDSATFISRNVILNFNYQKFSKKNKTLTIFVKHSLFFFFNSYIIILNSILLRFFWYKLVFFINAYNTSSLFKK